jgi:hypothetical protein
MIEEIPVIKTPYLFIVKTDAGTVYIRMGETEWDLAENLEFEGDKFSIAALRELSKHAVGMYGVPLNVTRTTPMDLNAALAYLEGLEEIKSFEIVFGYIPEESPSQVGDDGEARQIEPE